MTLTPLLTAPFMIQAHAIFAVLAVFLGPLALYRRRRDRLHKIVGYVWVLSILAVATTAVFIPSGAFAIFGHFGPIHLLILLTYFSLWQGMRAIWRRDIEAHRAAMAGLYWQGMAIAGLLTLLPGRTFNRALFPETPALGLVCIGLGGAALFWINWGRKWARRAPA